MADHSFTVEGMTCDHCVRAVREEVSGIPGVTDVDVELSTGALRVRADGDLVVEAVAAAVDEAGPYRLVAP